MKLQFALFLLAGACGHLSAATFTVIRIDDAGAGSLRDCIAQANSTPGADIIAFNIPGASPYTITLSQALPDVTGPTTIDATTQPGWAVQAPVVQIDCSGLFRPIVITGGDSTIRGLNIFNHQPGLYLTGGGNNRVEGCFIGTNLAGTAAGANTVTGTGIAVEWSSGNIIGGTTATARNIISGNNGSGIVLHTGTIGNVIQGNYLGTNVSGTAAVPNEDRGVYVNTGASNNLIGGHAHLGEGNLISGNTTANVFLGQGSTSTTLQGNIIGPDITGNNPIGNSLEGISGETSHNNLIGGTGQGHANTIAGNNQNILVAGSTGQPSTNWSIYGNRIGINSSGTGGVGTSPLGRNGTGVGVVNGSHDIRIGGKEPGMGNIIAHHYVYGVHTFSTEYNVTILGNSIHSNEVQMSIDLNNDGPTPNDALDADTGPNGLQNYPTIATVASGLGSTRIAGTLNSQPNTIYYLQFFKNTTCHSSGFGAGETLLGSAEVTTNGVGDAPYNLAFPKGSAAFVTATATDPMGNTSEFSPCFSNVTPIQASAENWELME